MKNSSYHVKITTLALFAILTVSLVGCGRAINRTAERKIREALPDAIGPARVYRVHVGNSAERTIQGRFSSVTIDGEDVRFPSGILMDSIHIELRNVLVDTGKGVVKQIGEAAFSMTLSETSLDEFIAGESPEGESIRKTRLTLGDNNLVTVEAERVVLGIGVPFRLSGPLKLISPTRVEIDPNRLTVVGIPIGGGPLQFLKRKIESSFDLSSLPIKVYLNSVSTRKGSITFNGALDTADLLLKAQEKR